LDEEAMKVSVLLLTLNEGKNLPRCLDALEWCDDIVVLDSGSKDDTCEIAKSAGARVIKNQFINFATQRNFGLDYGEFRHSWVLHIDADEVITSMFADCLSILEPEDHIEGYRVPSKIILNDKWLRFAGMYPTYQVRLTRQEGIRFIQVGHGQQEDSTPEKIGTFSEPYLHYNFSQGLREWFVKHIRYAEDEALQLVKDRESSKPFSSLFLGGKTDKRRALKGFVNRLPVVFRPLLRLLYTLVWCRGILDGRNGFLYALMMAAYETMIASFVIHLTTKSNKDRS